MELFQTGEIEAITPAKFPLNDDDFELGEFCVVGKDSQGNRFMAFRVFNVDACRQLKEYEAGQDRRKYLKACICIIYGSKSGEWKYLFSHDLPIKKWALLGTHGSMNPDLYELFRGLIRFQAEGCGLAVGYDHHFAFTFAVVGHQNSKKKMGKDLIDLVRENCAFKHMSLQETERVIEEMKKKHALDDDDEKELVVRTPDANKI